MSEFIDGNEMLTEYKIRDFELFEYVRSGLQPYKKATGDPIPPPDILQKRRTLNYHYKQVDRLNIEQKYLHASLSTKYGMEKTIGWLNDKYQYYKRSVLTPNSIFSRKIKNELIDIREKIRDEILKHYPDVDYSWKIYEPISQDEKAVVIACLVECTYKTSESQQIVGGEEHSDKGQSSPKKTQLTPHQKRKLECRKIAEKLLPKTPDMTIVDMYNEDEIQLAFEGHPYTIKTFRGWMEPLPFNRKRGRRPKNK